MGARCHLQTSPQIRRLGALILVTVGTQLPFPRLVTGLDAICSSLREPVIAQTNSVAPPPKNMKWAPFYSPAEMSLLFEECRVIVAHAGMGSIITAQRMEKPIIVVPRRSALSEHRNDHQVATARQLEGRTGIYVAWEVERVLDFLSMPKLPHPAPYSESLAELVSAIRSEIAL